MQGLQHMAAGVLSPCARRGLSYKGCTFSKVVAGSFSAGTREGDGER